MRFKDFEDLVDVDRNIGRVYPDRPLHKLPDKGARHHALAQLKEFISRLVFQRTIAGDTTQAFKVPKANIHIYTPAEASEDPKLKGVAFIPGPYSYDEKWVYALGRPEEDDDSRDKYGKGTCLVLLGYYVEDFTIETVAKAISAVRAINEGIRQSMRFFTDSAQLYLKCPKYFDQEAAFSIISGAGYSPDTVMEVQEKHVAHLQVELWVPEVVLVDYRTMRVVLDYGPNDENIVDGNVATTLG